MLWVEVSLDRRHLYRSKIAECHMKREDIEAGADENRLEFSIKDAKLTGGGRSRKHDCESGSADALAAHRVTAILK
jgi:hypothetical protein